MHRTAGNWLLTLICGTGSTGVACVELGRGFVGIEHNRKYFDLTVERLTAAYEVSLQPDVEPRKMVRDQFGGLVGVM